MSDRQRLRRRSRHRSALIVSGLAVLIGSMVWTVRRQTEARAVALSIDSLESVEVIERARFAAAMRRADSLASRVRLLEAAAKLGLRPASDEEISFIEDVSAPKGRTVASEVPEPR